MKGIPNIFFTALLIVFLSPCCVVSQGVPPQMEKVNWVSMQTAVEKADKGKKKIIVDVYTNWCGWCKKMDKDTYEKTNIVQELNKNFISVKFNAESRDTLYLKGKMYTFTPEIRSHSLAYSLLKGRMAYPSTVVLDENMELLTVVPGYLTAERMHPILLYFSSNAYKNLSFEEYQKKN